MKPVLRILNLEDEPNDTDLIKAKLKKDGVAYEMTRVETENDFVAAIQQGGVDLILSDFKLPAFDGLSALSIAKEKCPDIPFIFVSGSIGEEMAIETLKNGATDYVLKENLSRLPSSVRRAMNESEVRTERKRAEGALAASAERLKKALGATVLAIASVVETRDPYTAGHQRRVAHLAGDIATEMAIPSEKIEGIRVAGSIHDLGKISVPAEILSTPRKLTVTEFMLIKIHPQTGYDILKNIEFPWPIAQIVLQHHERMDGSGYPNGLKGEEILLEARILCLADVVEAMASHRPYRPAIGIEAALDEIENNKGTLYDADVVDVCLRLFREKGFKLEGT